MLKIKIPIHFAIASAMLGGLISYLVCAKTSYGDTWAGVLSGALFAYVFLFIPPLIKNVFFRKG